MSRSCDKLVEKAGGEGARGDWEATRNPRGQGWMMEWGLFFTLTNFSAKVPIQVSAFRFYYHQNSFLKLNLHTSKILKS